MPAPGAQRVLARLDELYAIGRDAGANRPGLSAQEQAAHELVAGWMREAGLEAGHDAAGNLVGRLPGRRPDLPEVWTGSHLDTVPDGGRFDGALGVVSGLEAVECAGAGDRTLAVVAFREEEGWRFRHGCIGSRAACAPLPEGVLDARDADGVSVREAYAAIGLAPPRPVPLPGAFVELHVEQGPVLARAGAPLGVVTAIAGQARATVELLGRPGHAGTTPMDARDDPLWKAAELVLRVRDATRGIEGAVATVGSLVVEPGASSVVPGRVVLTIDARAPDRERLDRLCAAIGVELRRSEPVPMDPELVGVVREEVAGLGMPVLELPSGAGHDAAVLAQAGVPGAMLFVRSLAGGISHAPEEESSPEDVELGVAALTRVLRRLSAR